MSRTLVWGLLVLTLLTTGCWNREELEHRAIVLGIGFDQVGNSIRMTAQIVRPAEVKSPSESSPGEKPVWVTSTTGPTVFDAVRNMATRSGRNLFLAHTKVVVIGEELAKSGINQVLDFFNRDHEGRRRTKVLITKGTAKEVLNTETALQKLPAIALNDMIESKAGNSFSPKTDIHKFQQYRYTPGMAPVAVHVETDPSSEKGKPERVRLAGTAVFHGDKLVGWLNLQETRGMLWITNHVKQGIVDVPCPDDPEKKLALEVIRSNSTVKAVKQESNLVITVNVNEEGRVGESTNCGELTPQVLRELEQTQAQVIESEIDSAIVKAKELKADVFGFGWAISRQLPNDWSRLEPQWENVFSNITVLVDVKSRLSGTGMTN